MLGDHHVAVGHDRPVVEHVPRERPEPESEPGLDLLGPVRALLRRGDVGVVAVGPKYAPTASKSRRARSAQKRSTRALFSVAVLTPRDYGPRGAAAVKRSADPADKLAHDAYRRRPDADLAIPHRLASELREGLGRVLRGKPEPVRLAVVTLLSGGHLLLDDVPGVGKTLLAKALARTAGGSFRRVQATPTSCRPS